MFTNEDKELEEVVERMRISYIPFDKEKELTKENSFALLCGEEFSPVDISFIKYKWPKEDNEPMLRVSGATDIPISILIEKLYEHFPQLSHTIRVEHLRKTWPTNEK